MIPKICAFAIVSSLLAVFLGDLGFKNKKLISILSSVLILSAANEGVGVFVNKVTDLSKVAGISEACLCALKAVGLGYVFGFTADVCTELGEVGVAKAVTIAGKLEILIVALPYFEKAIELGFELLK